MTDDIIVVKDLVKAYGDKPPVLNGVSFSVRSGELVLVQGKSGCGKTTLLNILGGLDRPTSGDVIIDGESIVGLSEDRLASLRLEKIGFVFQDYNLLLDLSVRENVALPLRFSKRSDGELVDAMLEKFDIASIAEEKASRISGGEAQRVAIARAMMNRPVIILADEPTGNLDEDNTEKVMTILELVKNDFDTSIVLATHDQELAGRDVKRTLLLGGTEHS
jgi:putative ABC transport system ATP-binding protein